MAQAQEIDITDEATQFEVVKAFEAIVDHLPYKTVRWFGKKLHDTLEEVKDRGIQRLNGELFLAECEVIFQMANNNKLPPEHMALVNKLRKLVQ